MPFEGRSRTSHSQLAWRPAVRVPFAQPFWATLCPELTAAQSVVNEAFSVSISRSLESLQAALAKKHSPKEALITLFARVKGAVSSTKCASATLIPPDHPLFSFVELAVWLVICPDDLGVFDGVGFRAARCQGKVMLRFAESTEYDSTDLTLAALARMLS